ncbi:acyl-CoA dehydrogenase [bacterium M00.F.Ca.ET.228.01.1.1]|uniref:acyl-CoA dehydrogenase n=1 Tax=Paraburkholderia phenoliruptrix TaxID=252970 RepID=UPI00109262D4|nr:acyl-CoA dehydrogenase [Paraburkholderia phenoliruptrix]TGP39523.1 acyl-CoA dehydrogenase [bacterium M00.F.Ca.ET.228.01.1.1]TGR95257.1 acyl-CoA dehydrogenase [bacterium M00.F.Ca.ET.191.01.1.1]TGT96103.1 acyl-CoA dehydrogenase [bacterium M00.F.Ca.ET.155.01.1.1]MBW0448272.1 acyl-CoA dehydrogenase [Paraburkholderia phenoliruptrix]MBW9099483.1 acyl-CoA dehydrogenase [Paraburkholderia phenoliruptrix]
MDSETQQAFKDSARDLIARGDVARRRAALLAGNGALDRDAWKQMAEAGWTAMLIPEQSGGLGLGVPEVIAIAEEAGRAALPEPFVAAAVLTGAVLAAVSEHGAAQALIEAVGSGESVVGIAWQHGIGQLEPSADSPTRYRRDGDTIVLDGTLHFVAPLVGADGWVVLANGSEGLMLVWLAADTSGIELKGSRGIDGASLGTLHLQRCTVQATQVLMEGEEVLDTLAQALDIARIAQAAELLGIARAALEATIDYTCTRVQFGRAIGSFQALQHRLVDGYIQTELAAAALRDAAAADRQVRSELASSASRAKARSAQAALWVTRLAVQLHGAIGYTEEGPIGPWLKRAIALSAWLGNERAHRARYCRLRPAGRQMRRDATGTTPPTDFPRDADWDAMPEAQFRRMVRAFFSAHYPEALRYFPRRLHWNEIAPWYRTLSEQGWIAPAWPKEFGGMALPPDKLIAWIEEQELFGVGRPPDQGLIMLGPILIRYGSDAQRAQYLPKILSGEHVWAQGYSEPNAGSDLASLRTRALLDGDSFIVSGQKTWSTLAQDATHMFMLVRTDNSGRKQEGISFLLVDLKSPGVTVRPIRTIAGDEEFCEVFFDDVRVPKGNLVGELHRGWDIAKQLLGFERLFSGSPKHSQHALAQLRELAESRGLLADPAWADAYASAQLDVADLVSAYGGFADTVKRGETLPVEVSWLKIWATETHERVAMLLNEAAAESAMCEQAVSTGSQPVHIHAPLFNAMAAKIFSGSNEIQRNILARQVLRLPV